MRSNMRLLSTIQQSPIEGVVDLVAELVTSELDAPRFRDCRPSGVYRKSKVGWEGPLKLC